MATVLISDLDAALKMMQFWDERNKWAVETFGDHSIRGPLGALRHLAKEVQEAISEIENSPMGPYPDNFFKELIDCKFLVEEAMSRAGMTYAEVADKAFAKLEENKKRKWPPIVAGNNPVEHVK
jgi:hypothetical protein